MSSTKEWQDFVTGVPELCTLVQQYMTELDEKLGDDSIKDVRRVMLNQMQTDYA